MRNTQLKSTGIFLRHKLKLADILFRNRKRFSQKRDLFPLITSKI